MHEALQMSVPALSPVHGQVLEDALAMQLVEVVNQERSQLAMSVLQARLGLAYVRAT